MFLPLLKAQGIFKNSPGPTVLTWESWGPDPSAVNFGGEPDGRVPRRGLWHMKLLCPVIDLPPTSSSWALVSPHRNIVSVQLHKVLRFPVSDALSEARCPSTCSLSIFQGEIPVGGVAPGQIFNLRVFERAGSQHPG